MALSGQPYDIMVNMKIVLKIKYNLFFLIICSSAVSQLAAQSTDQVFKMALQQKKEGRYEQAIKSFKRLMFFDGEMQYPSVLIELADCYYVLNEFNSSYDYYDLAGNQALSDSVKSLCLIRKVACKLFQRELNEAKVELLSIDTNLLKGHKLDYHLLNGITYYSLGDYTASRNYFSLCLPENQDSVDLYFNNIVQLQRRFKPGLAKVMSMIIPGSGQVYAGDWKNGLNSFFLSAGFLSLGAAMMGSLSFIDSAVLVLPWFQRYYTGGFQKAYEITNNRLYNELNNNLLQIVKLAENNQCK
jgi:tetratricopeptide (TPR) repeat protein